MTDTPVECYRRAQIYRSDTYADEGYPYLVKDTYYGDYYGPSIAACKTVINYSIDNYGHEFCQCGASIVTQDVAVYYQDGSPASGISIFAEPSSLPPCCNRSATTNSFGKALLSKVVRGYTYRLTVTPPASYTCENSCKRTITIDPSVTIQFILISKVHRISLPLSIPSLSLSIEVPVRALSPIQLSLPVLSVSLSPGMFRLKPVVLDPIEPLTPLRPYFKFDLQLSTFALLAASALDVVDARLYGFRNITGLMKPPFRCPICGRVFYTHEDYISHVLSHIAAYEDAAYD